MTEHIAILLDYQNVHLVGRDIFSPGVAPYRCVPHPARLADLIASSSITGTGRTYRLWRRALTSRSRST
jgi:hypothetical protein